MDKFCPNCSIVLPATAGRCTSCGGIATLAPGTVVTGLSQTTYTIESVLGIGGMGLVYKAASSSGSAVVVKELYVENLADLPDAQRRFQREAQVQASIVNPAFPLGFGYFQDLTREFMAMEFIPGNDLEKVLTQRPGGKMTEDEVLQLGIQMCDALEVLHTHTAAGQPDPIVHRDIKPANIILRPSGQICILDLGIARAIKQSAATQARATRAGTFEYCSPQQVSGVDMSERDDIYSLAATQFHLLTGDAFAGGFPDRAGEVDALPAAWRSVFRKAIDNDTHLRHRSVGEFKTDLIGLLPANLRANYQQPAVQTATPVAAGQISIRWKPSGSTMIGPGEYRQAIAGQVMRNGQGVPGARVIPFKIDIGGAGTGTGAQGTAVPTGVHGDFALAVPDITVPVAVDRRQIEVVVEDASGIELYRETVAINRPFGASVVQLNSFIMGALKSPFKAIAEALRNWQLGRAALIQAKSAAKAANVQAKAARVQARQQAKAAKAQATQQVQQAKTQAKANAIAAGTYVSPGQKVKNVLGWPFRQLGKIPVASAFTSIKNSIPKSGPNTASAVSSAILIVLSIFLVVLLQSTRFGKLWFPCLIMGILLMFRATLFRKKLGAVVPKGKPRLGRTFALCLIAVTFVVWAIYSWGN